MTARRARCTRRGNPRQSVRVLQRILYRAAKANPRRRLGILYDKVFRRDVLLEATRRVLANRGAGGVDGVTAEHLRAHGVERFEVRSTVTGTPEAAGRHFGWQENLFRRMGLETNRDKTRIARVTEGFDFLGLTFRKGRGRGTGRRFALSYPRRKAMKAIRRKIKETARRRR